MESSYQILKLNKFREIISFSFLFITYFSGEISFTREIFGFIRYKQEKVIIKTLEFDDGWSYQSYWVKKYRWIKC